MQRLIAGAALAVLLAPWVGLAQPQPRDGAMIYGRGNGTCGSWAEDRKFGRAQTH
jgi:hypothetical protein